VVTPWSEFPSVVEGARWLVLAAPLTEDTWHLLDHEMLSLCDGVYLINVARGALVEEESLPLALDRGWLSGAALDVFETEPLPSASPLWGHPGVVISPHCSGVTDVRAAALGFLECLAALERGELPGWVIDREIGY
jgi:glyoxylate/hydroxypyruvate reductase A